MDASEMTNGQYAELVETYIREHWPGGYPGEQMAECLQLDGDEDCQAREFGTFTGVPQKVEYCANCKAWHDLRREAEALLRSVTLKQNVVAQKGNSMDPLFRVHRLNEAGLKKADSIAQSFDALLTTLKTLCPDSREFSIAKDNLEQACFFAKKSIANDPANQQL